MAKFIVRYVTKDVKMAIVEADSKDEIGKGFGNGWLPSVPTHVSSEIVCITDIRPSINIGVAEGPSSTTNVLEKSDGQ